jgi:hypothetical protein
MPITFTEANIKLTYFPHIDAMVITTHIDKRNVTRVSVDNGSQTEILFLSAYDQMGFDKKQLKEASKPLCGFRGRIEPIGSISLPVSFDSLHNTHTEHITLDVVDMHYAYNAIFGRGLINTLALGVILNQKGAKNIEQGFAPSHRNVNYLQDRKAESCNNCNTRFL